MAVGAGTDEVLRVTGGLALAGCAAVAIANIIGSIIVDGHNWITDTISYLAEGRYAWIQDAGLVVFAAGVIGLAVGLWRLNLGGFGWRAGAACLVLMGVDIAMIALRNEYGERTPNGIVVHSELVWALGGLFGLALLLLARGLGRVGPGWRRGTIAAALIWLVLAPPFFLIPTGFDGLYERALALLVIGWIVPVAVLLLEEGRAR